MEKLDGMIAKAREQVLNSQELEETYAFVELAKIRIKENAKKINYVDWYGIRELDGKQLLLMDELEFIQTLYRAVLKRKPASEDVHIVQSSLHFDHSHRIDVIDTVLESEEAKAFEPVMITGIDSDRKKLYVKRKIKAIPLIGYVLRFCKSIILLPRELTYLQKQLDNLNKDASSIRHIHENVQNLNANVQNLNANAHDLNEAVDDINQVLKINHLSVHEKEIEEQRKAYEKQLVDRFYVQYNEELFKESRELLKERKKIYIEKIEQHFNEKNKTDITVVDLGCGTGEWIEVLQEAGYYSLGVDSNVEVVNKVRNLYPHLNICCSDSVAYLKSQPDNSLDIITSFHMVEHMEIVEIMELCTETARVLKQGGILIMETPNPLNILISSYYFNLDPTHKKPIPPELLEVYVHAGNLEVKERIYVNPLNFIPYEYEDEDPIKDLVFRFNMEQAYSIMAVKK